MTDSTDDDRPSALEACWNEIDAWDVERKRLFAEPIPESPPDPTADEIGAAWLTIWLEAPAWTINEAATVLAGIVPNQADLCFPGRQPRGTINGEGREPIIENEQIFRP